MFNETFLTEYYLQKVNKNHMNTVHLPYSIKCEMFASPWNVWDLSATLHMTYEKEKDDWDIPRSLIFLDCALYSA